MAIFRDRIRARNRNGDEAFVEVAIGRPERVQGARGEHSCPVVLTGLVTWNIEIFGSSALQATELAFFSVRSRLAGMERVWSFYDDKGESLSFAGIPNEGATS